MSQKRSKEKRVISVETSNFHLSPTEVNLHKNMLYHPHPIESFSVRLDYRIDYTMVERFYDDPDPQAAQKGHRTVGFFDKTAVVTWYHPHEVFEITCDITVLDEHGVVSHQYPFVAFYKDEIFARPKGGVKLNLLAYELDCVEATIKDVIYEVKDWISAPLII